MGRDTAIITLFTTTKSDFIDIVTIVGSADYDSIRLYSAPNTDINLVAVSVHRYVGLCSNTPVVIAERSHDALNTSLDNIIDYKILITEEEQQIATLDFFHYIIHSKFGDLRFHMKHKAVITDDIKVLDKLIPAGYLIDLHEGETSAYTRVWKTNHCGGDLERILGYDQYNDDALFQHEDLVKLFKESPNMEVLTYESELPSREAMSAYFKKTRLKHVNSVRILTKYYKDLEEEARRTEERIKSWRKS